MILQLFRRKSKANEAIMLRVYEAIVAAARQKRFFAQFHVPDTALGRYEMLSLHVFMALHRMRGENFALTDLAQRITDEFFKDVDHSLRELGIGDQSVPKRIKKLARMFYGRVNAYSEALDADDGEALAAALTRNIRPDLEFWPSARHLSAYVMHCRDRLQAIDDNALVAGEISFMDADALDIPEPAQETTKEVEEND